MFLHVTEAEYLQEYKIKMRFNDGKEGIADLKDALKGEMFSPLLDQTVFSKFKLDQELETLVWPNGADLAPEFLYFKAFKEEQALRPQFIKWGYVV